MGAFEQAKYQAGLESHLLQCASGRELAGKQFAGDVRLASRLNCSNNTPLLDEGFYRPV
jgi:hypothetical protein